MELYCAEVAWDIADLKRIASSTLILRALSAYHQIVNTDRLHCPNCGTVYQKPEGPLEQYRCVKCGYHPLVQLEQDSATKQAALAVVGALAGLGLAGGPGAIVGGIIGYLAASGNK